ncbi:MAG: hypothetical protein CL854_04835, partial [Cryomorphaceae bacterium]|nr:hypothetical protein [Cryomorphaceae bacterium]
MNLRFVAALLLSIGLQAQGIVEVHTSAEVLRMKLYSPAGQLVYEGPFDTKLDLSSYPAGTYQLVFR